MWKKSQASSTSLTFVGGAQQLGERLVVAVEQPGDELFLGRVVVVEVARADAHLGRDQGRRDVGLAETVEEVERGVQDALGGAARFLRLRGHGSDNLAPAPRVSNRFAP
jgi:hypothetical protein